MGPFTRVALHVLVEVVLAREAHRAVAAPERPVHRVRPYVPFKVTLIGKADGTVAALEGEGWAPGDHVMVMIQPRKKGV